MSFFVTDYAALMSIYRLTGKGKQYFDTIEKVRLQFKSIALSYDYLIIFAVKYLVKNRQ